VDATAATLAVLLDAAARLSLQLQRLDDEARTLAHDDPRHAVIVAEQTAVAREHGRLAAELTARVARASEVEQ
jgi:hypothetical protein